MLATSETKPSRSWKRAAGWALAGASAAAVAIGYVASHSHHFQHHNERLLRELASSTSIQVQFTTRDTGSNSVAGLTMTGMLFPRTDATTQKLTFDGRISYDFLGQEYNFTMIDGRGYVTVEKIDSREMVRNDCLIKENIPPVHLFVDALREARVVDSVENIEVPCENGKLVQFEFEGEPYVFCSRENGSIDKIHGDDLEATVQLLRDNTASAPSIDMLVRPGGKTMDECEVLVDEADILAYNAGKVQAARRLKRAASWFSDALALVTGNDRVAQSEDCTTACKGGKKICLFVHGLGKSLDAPVADTYEDAWGEYAWKNMNCCSQTKFMRMDTVNNPWYTDTLPKKVCDTAIDLTKSKDPMNLENIAIISHSMGNLIVANGALKNFCAIGPSSKWITLAGPIAGSRSANIGINVCSANPVVFNETMKDTLQSVNVCPAKKATHSLVYEDSDKANAELNDMYEKAIGVVKQRATASMCGVSSIGLASTRSAKYYLLGLISGHKSDHDGAVEINSCSRAFGADKYQTSWKGGNLYKASVNHADSSLRNGDGLWGESRKPIKWLNCQF